MRNEELAQPTRVKNKHKVKDSTERSDFASWETIGKICRGDGKPYISPLAWRVT